jgi:general secretion pathway protein L
MSLLRIYAPLAEIPLRCQWALLDDGGRASLGEGLLADLPRRTGRVQLLIPAAQVLLTRARIPRAARRGGASVLAFAVEEQTVGDPAASQVSWLGAVGDADALAVADGPGLARWHEALGAVGMRIDAVHCETLLLPIRPGEWSLAWNGSEGFVRSGTLEGAATDCAATDAPPLSLRLMLDEARARGAEPTAIALYVMAPDAAPDLAAWQRELGVTLRLAGSWDWRTAPAAAGIGLAQQGRRLRLLSGAAARLRPAAWILGAALALHGVALVADWAMLAGEQRELRQQMEARFRASFPEAVAVADPALQMRRKLAEARHGAGQSDGGDFLPLATQLAAATRELPPAALRVMSYAGGQMTLEIVGNDATAIQRISSRLSQSGLGVETAAAATNGGRTVTVMSVRAP